MAQTSARVRNSWVARKHLTTWHLHLSLHVGKYRSSVGLGLAEEVLTFGIDGWGACLESGLIVCCGEDGGHLVHKQSQLTASFP